MAKEQHTGDFEEVYEPVSDPLIQLYLKNRQEAGIRSPFQDQKWKRKMRMLLPFAPNMTQKEFIPTQAFSFLSILKNNFPRHRLVLSDFNELLDSVNGINGPVVQTMFEEEMIACSTYLVEPGWFDIFFPTQFQHLKQLYDYTLERDASQSQVCSYKEFLNNYATTHDTQLRSGENPMLDFYKNVSFFLS